MDVVSGGYRPGGDANDLSVLTHLPAGRDVSQRHLVAGGNVVAQPDADVAGEDVRARRQRPGHKADAVVGSQEQASFGSTRVHNSHSSFLACRSGVAPEGDGAGYEILSAR